MCMAHLYGVALYFSTGLVETHFTGLAHSRPEFLYFWVYYVGFNLPWAVVPACKFYILTASSSWLGTFFWLQFARRLTLCYHLLPS